MEQMINSYGEVHASDRNDSGKKRDIENFDFPETEFEKIMREFREKRKGESSDGL